MPMTILLENLFNLTVCFKHYAVATCEIKFFANNLEIIAVFIFTYKH